MCGIAMPVQKRLAFLRTEESFEDAFAGQSRAEGDEAAGEKFGVDGDVGVDAEEGSGTEAAKAVQAGEHFVEDNG